MQIVGDYLRTGEGTWTEKGPAMSRAALEYCRQSKEQGKRSGVRIGLFWPQNSEAHVAGVEWAGGRRVENESGNPLWDSAALGDTEYYKTLFQIQIASDYCTL